MSFNRTSTLTPIKKNLMESTHKQFEKSTYSICETVVDLSTSNRRKYLQGDGIEIWSRHGSGIFASFLPAALNGSLRKCDKKTEEWQNKITREKIVEILILCTTVDLKLLWKYDVYLRKNISSFTSFESLSVWYAMHEVVANYTMVRIHWIFLRLSEISSLTIQMLCGVQLLNEVKDARYRCPPSAPWVRKMFPLVIHKRGP